MTRAEQVKALAKKGHHQAEIARLLGVSRERVRQICANNGIKTVRIAGPDSADVKHMREAAPHMTVKEYCEKTGRSLASTYVRAKGNGIKFKAPELKWKELQKHAEAGLTLTQAARAMGWTTQCAWTQASVHGIKFKAVRAERQCEVKGVSWNRACGKWIAYIRRQGINKYLGSFSDVNDAIAARLKAEKETA